MNVVKSLLLAAALCVTTGATGAEHARLKPVTYSNLDQRFETEQENDPGNARLHTSVFISEVGWEEDHNEGGGEQDYLVTVRINASPQIAVSILGLVNLVDRLNEQPELPKGLHVSVASECLFTRLWDSCELALIPRTRAIPAEMIVSGWSSVPFSLPTVSAHFADK